MAPDATETVETAVTEDAATEEKKEARKPAPQSAKAETKTVEEKEDAAAEKTGKDDKAKDTKASKPETKAVETVDEADEDDGFKIRLDRGRDFGTIRGTHPQGVKFMQDGYCFDVHGNHIEDIEREEPPKPAPKQLPQAVQKDQSEHVYAGVNLADWAAGKALHKWADVQNAIFSATGKRPGTKTQGLELVINHGIAVSKDMIERTASEDE